MPKPKNKLTEKQKRFCELYMVDLNATQAAIGAGYSKKTATVQGFENLTKPYIADYIQQLREKQQERTRITADQVLKDLEEIKDACKSSGDNTNALKAVDMFMKHYGLYEKDNTRKVDMTMRPVITFGDTSKKDDD